MPLDRSKSLVDQLQVRAAGGAAAHHEVLSAAVVNSNCLDCHDSACAQRRSTFPWDWTGISAETGDRGGTQPQMPGRYCPGAGLVTHLDGQIHGLAPVQGCVIVPTSLSPNLKGLKRLDAL